MDVNTETPIRKMTIVDLTAKIAELREIDTKGLTGVEKEKLHIKMVELKNAYSLKIARARLQDEQRIANNNKRKSRTHGLIVNGGLWDVFLPGMTAKDVLNVLEELTNDYNFQTSFAKALRCDISKFEIEETKAMITKEREKLNDKAKAQKEKAVEKAAEVLQTTEVGNTPTADTTEQEIF